MAGWVGGSFVRFVHRRRVVAFKPFYIPSSQHTPVYPPAAPRQIPSSPTPIQEDDNHNNNNSHGCMQNRFNARIM